MDLETEFRDIVNAHLDTLTPKFEQELSDIMSQGIPDRCKAILFEYDSPFFGDEFAVHLYFIDKDITAITAHNFLQGEVVVPSEIYDDEKYEEICAWGRASEVLDEWLVKRWDKYKDIPQKAYAGHHDTAFLTLLNTGKEVKWDELKGI